MGIEPTLSAWKAGVLPLNYTRKCQLLPTMELRAGIAAPSAVCSQPLSRLLIGGGRRIRTSEAEAADLQSAPFDRSGIPPKPSGELSYAAIKRVNTPDTRIVVEKK